jgi:hypothetical protein
MVLILFETLEFCFLHVDQFRKEEKEGEQNNSEFGMLTKGSLNSRKDSEINSGAETNDSEHNEEKKSNLTGGILKLKEFFCYIFYYFFLQFF